MQPRVEGISDDMKNTRQLIPTARRADLVVQEVEGETLVYDLKSHKAHCLNRTSALVWKMCDGRHTAVEVARKLETEMGTPVSTEMIWLAIDQLEKRKLLEGRVERAPGATQISRRELARRLGIATALTLPFIASINAPAAIQAVSGCGGNGAPCGGINPPCCPGFACGDAICFPT